MGTIGFVFRGKEDTEERKAAGAGAMDLGATGNGAPDSTGRRASGGGAPDSTGRRTSEDGRTDGMDGGAPAASCDRMILGEGAIYSTDSNVTGLNNNVIVCGSSGSGKTMSIAEPRLLETYHSSLVVTVTKKRLIKKYQDVLRRRGYEVEVLDFVTPLEGTVSFDPIKYIRGYSDITFLAKSVVEMTDNANAKDMDPYWYDAGASLLAAEIAYILMTKENPKFGDVLKMHDSLRISGTSERIETTLDEKFETLESIRPGCFAVTCWKSFREIAPRTARCVFGMVNSALDKIFAPELREAMGVQKPVDFPQLGKKRTVLFVASSPVNPSIHCFINLFYAQAFKELFEFAEKQPDGTLPVPVHMLCDDFATGGRVQNFPEYISIFREKKISVTLLIQSESQLAGIYEKTNATTIINNCDTYVYMGSMDLDTARNVSYRLDAPLNEVLCFPLGKLAIFRRGTQPLVTERYNIMKDERWQEITEEYEKRQGVESASDGDMERMEKVIADGEKEGTEENVADGEKEGMIESVADL